MSKNTNLGQNQNDKSYLQRYQDPPSQSRIMMLDDIMNSESGVDSSIQQDAELSRVMFDQFNKSIISKQGGKLGPKYPKGDKSAMIMDRSSFGLNSQGDKSMYQDVNDKSMLRGLNLHNDQSSCYVRVMDANASQTEESKD